LSDREIVGLAYESGFIKREARKIDASLFLANMCLSAQKGSPSYNDLAARYQSVYNIAASKQAFWKKVNPNCIVFFQKVLARIIKAKISSIALGTLKGNVCYKRVLVQDSTIIKLPLQLFEVFSGVSNAHTAVCNARIQGVYDLLSGNFLSFSIDPYSKNDLSAAPELDIQAEDLVLRDRGYSSFSEITRQVELGAHFIFRHKFNNTYVNPHTGHPIDLKSVLIENHQIDLTVCLNDKNRTPVRLIAIPIKEEIATTRRMKAKKEMRGHNPLAELMFLMGWTIFITNIPQTQASAQKILSLYGLRWRIETIFKTCKYYMGFDKIHNVSESQLRCILLARFIMIVICISFIYQPYYYLSLKKHKKYLSMMKLINYLILNTEILSKALIALFTPYQQNEILNIFTKYCSYDGRKRLNYCQFFEEIILS
jgi:hypothetical protein